MTIPRELLATYRFRLLVANFISHWYRKNQGMRDDATVQRMREVGACTLAKQYEERIHELRQETGEIPK